MAARPIKRAAPYRKLFSGLLLGIAFLMPGVSGGALAASLGYFEPMIAAISGFFKAPRKSVRYLWPLCAGCVLGMLLSGGLILQWMNRAETQAISLFFGLVAGSLPSLWRDVYPEKQRVRPWHAALIVLGILVTISLFWVDLDMIAGQEKPVTLSMAFWSGCIYGAGAVIPGISGAFFLIYFGWYKPVMNAIVALDWGVLGMTVLGFAGMALLLVKGVDWLFRRFRQGMLLIIIGFVIGSLALVYPDDFFGPLWWVNCLLALLGAGVGVVMGHAKKVEEAAA